MISALAAIAGGTIERSFAYPSVEAARKFVALAGHEIASPAAAIKGLTFQAMSLCLKIVSPASQYHDEVVRLAGELHSEVRDFQRMVNLAALVSQAGGGQLEFHFENLSLYSIMRRAATMVQTEQSPMLAQTREIEFHFDQGARNVGEVSCDGTLLREAFGNLFRNAAKYSFPRASGAPVVVTVSGQASPDGITIRVTNFGIGIPRDRLETIFEPFVRGGVTDTKRAIRGMGLGLYMSRLIIEGHNGRLRCVGSWPAWNDPKRVAKFEGYETTFEASFPRIRQTLGTETIDIESIRRND
jgi:signal transduction histidine kinase